MAKLSNRPAAIVTGASRGIGRAVAVALARTNFNVAVNYRANDRAAHETADQVRAAGAEGILIQADVGKPDDRTRLCEKAVEALGPIALLVNNAGISSPQRNDILAADLAAYRTVMATNLEGPFFLSQWVARHMIDQRQRYPAAVTPMVINIGSISAYAVSVQRAEYCLAKAGLAMLTRLLAVRLAGHDILVYEVRPGVIATDMALVAKEKYDRLILEGDLLPTRRWGTPEDVAAAVGALVRGEFPYSTGAVFDVDGGFHIARL